MAHLRGRTALGDYAGLFAMRPWIAVALILALLSLVGVPPLIGFAGKLALFATTIEAGWWWLAAAAVANTVVSLFYYLRVIAPMVFGEPARGAAVLGRISGAVVALATAGVLGLGLAGEAAFLAAESAQLLP